MGVISGGEAHVLSYYGPESFFCGAITCTWVDAHGQLAEHRGELTFEGWVVVVVKFCVAAKLCIGWRSFHGRAFLCCLKVQAQALVLFQQTMKIVGLSN
jgi:hypothetical protein